MNKSFFKIYLLIMALMVAHAIHAQQISKEEALQKAQSFINKNFIQQSTRSFTRQASRLVLANNSRELFVFNDEANGGYIVVSGDERMPDVLGYSYKGHYAEEEIPCNMQAWLESYAEQVKYLQTHPEASVTTRNETDRASINPLLQTKWSQDEPYNNLCPEISGLGRCPTGCVATAMAQIMNYFQWPKQTVKPIPDYEDASGCPITTIDWDNMLPRYDQWYSPEQGNAVAMLMKLCGTAVKMVYSYDKSSSSGIKCREAFLRYFDYSAEIANSKDYDFDEWCQILYDELADGFPIFYSGKPNDEDHGNDEEPGHAFVLDGYDRGGYFHINWGWGGSHDDYFLLTELTFKDYGWDYSYRQSAVLEIRPYKPGIPNMHAKLEGETLTFYYDREGKRSDNIYSKGDLQAMNDIENLNMTTGRYEGRPKVTEMVIDPSLASYKPTPSLDCFSNWYDLIKIKGLEHLNTSRIRYMNSMFLNCESLESLDVSGFNTEKVTDMSNMFGGCSSLKIIDLSSLDTRKVDNMSYMFGNCKSLEELNLSGIKTDNVKNMDMMFYYCSRLKELDLSDFHTKAVTNMDGMFQGNVDLTSIYVSEGWKTENVERAGEMFKSCEKLVGGKGTVYSHSHDGIDYAHIDGGPENPGYFTYKVSTGLQQPVTETASSPAVYSLSGVKVRSEGKGAEGLPAGIYIVGRKKMVVK